jgi:hypothetical protein
MVTLDDVADELYSLPPEEFVTTRTAREQAAKADGDKELAAAIKQLPKPDASAWLANQLARNHADEIQPLLDLGAALREATANLSGDQLRELGKQQRQLIHALVQQAKKLASDGGRKVADATARELEVTLHAALADENAGAQLAAGRLTKGLESVGFASEGATERTSAKRTAAERTPPRQAEPPESTAPRSISSAPSLAARRKAAELERARELEERAEEAATEADAARELAEEAATEIDDSVTVAAEKITSLRGELDEAEAALTALEKKRRAANAELARADRVATIAHRRLEEAKERRGRLVD